MTSTNGSNGNGSNGSNGKAVDKRLPPAGRVSGHRGSRFGVGMPVEKSENFGASARRLLKRMHEERLRIVMVLVSAVASVGLTVLGPRILGDATNVVVDGIQSPKGVDFDHLHSVLMVAVAIYVGAGLLNYLQGFLIAGVVQRSMSRLRRDIEAKVNNLPLSYIDNEPLGDLLSRVTNDIDNVAQSLQQSLSMLLTASLTIVGVLVMMFLISPLLAGITIIIVPCSVLIMKVITKRSRPRFIEQWEYTGTLNAQIEEAFTGHNLVKVFGQQGVQQHQFDDRNDRLYESSFSAQFISGCVQPATMFLGNLNFLAIAVIGGLKVSNGTMSVGDIQAFIQYSRQFTQPLTQIAAMANTLQSGIASLERVFELLDVEEQSDDPTEPLVDPAPEGRIEFEHVSFAYDPTRPLIEDLSLTAQPGATVAIVGPTGAGKTTLVNLIMRFYDVDDGRITLDGRPTMEMRRHDLRATVGMVLQDTWLFEGTIRENIAFGNPGATEEEIVAAAKATHVDHFVRSLPDGYDTVVDDEGTNVSAGEKQLLTIARAFLANPTILILDEATSSVDTRTEVLIQKAMAALRSNRTSFVIAHRLSTIRDADTILVMEQGDIVEQGNHSELLERDGAYARLYNSQFSGAAIDVD
jgi:ATP-binding cassette subfamily B protein